MFLRYAQDYVHGNTRKVPDMNYAFMPCADRANETKSDIILTWLLTFNSARTKFILQPPPIRKERLFPLILKGGDVRVPWGRSPCFCPAGVSLDGRCS